MILETDFLDHWKTRMLSDLLEDKMAPLYVIRLWCHCQLRKSVQFDDMTAQAMKAICQFPGDGAKLIDCLAQCGFIERNETGISVPKFAETNSKMFSNWGKGRFGVMGGNPKLTQTEPNANPVSMVGMVGKEGDIGLVGRSANQPPNPLPCGSQEEDQAAAKAAEAYQIRRYRTPDPNASYYSKLLSESLELFRGKPDVGRVLDAFLAVCRAPHSEKLPQQATFSDIAIAAGLKFLKGTANSARASPPKAAYKDYTAERLAKEKAIT